MGYLNRLGFLPLLVASALPAVAADFDYAAYKRSSIPEIVEKHKATECRPTAPRESVFSAYAYKYRIITTFSRELRAIADDTRGFLQRYGKAFQWTQEVLDSYKHEFLVKDSGKDYWVPVQESLLPAMGQELQKGQRFELYVAVLGATNNRCLFVATEFAATPK